MSSYLPYRTAHLAGVGTSQSPSFTITTEELAQLDQLLDKQETIYHLSKKHLEPIKATLQGSSWNQCNQRLRRINKAQSALEKSTLALSDATPKQNVLQHDYNSLSLHLKKLERHCDALLQYQNKKANELLPEEEYQDLMNRLLPEITKTKSEQKQIDERRQEIAVKLNTIESSIEELKVAKFEALKELVYYILKYGETDSEDTELSLELDATTEIIGSAAAPAA